jgi:CHAT domain-containing protein
VLANHWNVSDKAASRLMTEFMRRWQVGEPRAQARREAQLSLLHSQEFANPFFWAAFTLTGRGGGPTKRKPSMVDASAGATP